MLLLPKPTPPLWSREQAAVFPFTSFELRFEKISRKLRLLRLIICLRVQRYKKSTRDAKLDVLFYLLGLDRFPDDGEMLKSYGLIVALKFVRDISQI